MEEPSVDLKSTLPVNEALYGSKESSTKTGSLASELVDGPGLQLIEASEN